MFLFNILKSGIIFYHAVKIKLIYTNLKEENDGNLTKKSMKLAFRYSN